MPSSPPALTPLLPPDGALPVRVWVSCREEESVRALGWPPGVCWQSKWVSLPKPSAKLSASLSDEKALATSESRSQDSSSESVAQSRSPNATRRSPMSVFVVVFVAPMDGFRVGTPSCHARETELVFVRKWTPCEIHGDWLAAPKPNCRVTIVWPRWSLPQRVSHVK